MKAREFLLKYLKGGVRKTNVFTGIVLAFILASAGLYASDIVSSLITFNAGDPASASQVNYNFQTLGSAIDKNREGVACETTAAIFVDSSAGTGSAFTCDNCIQGYPSQPTGTDLFTASEEGVYQIKMVLLVSSVSSSASFLLNSAYGQVYINGSSDTIAGREAYKLSSGDVVSIMIQDTTSTGGSYVLPGSLVYVKRIF